jgi:hypothetical protein
MTPPGKLGEGGHSPAWCPGSTGKAFEATMPGGTEFIRASSFPGRMLSPDGYFPALA